MPETRVAELAPGAEATPVLVHREADLRAPALDERRMPLLVVQQAAQAESGRGAGRGLRATWGDSGERESRLDRAGPPATEPPPRPQPRLAWT